MRSDVKRAVRLGSIAQRIDMPYSRKPPEIVVSGVHRGAPLDGHGSDVRIGCQVAGGPNCAKQVTQDRPMVCPGADRLDKRLIKPAIDERGSVICMQRTLEDAGVSRDPEKGEQRYPRESQGHGSG